VVFCVARCVGGCVLFSDGAGRRRAALRRQHAIDVIGFDVAKQMA